MGSARVKIVMDLNQPESYNVNASIKMRSYQSADENENEYIYEYI